MILKEVELVVVDGKNYLASADTNNELFIFSIGDTLTVAYFDDLLGSEIQWVKNVAIEPEQIGYVFKGGKDDDVYEMALITDEDINTIKQNDGKCYIEVSELFETTPDDLEIHQTTFIPVLIDNKVIIHLNEKI